MKIPSTSLLRDPPLHFSLIFFAFYPARVFYFSFLLPSSLAPAFLHLAQPVRRIKSKRRERLPLCFLCFPAVRFILLTLTLGCTLSNFRNIES